MVQKQIMHCYLRVSTSVQETKGTSLKTQKDAAIAIAKRLDMDFQIHNEGGKSSSKDDLNNRLQLTFIEIVNGVVTLLKVLGFIVQENVNMNQKIDKVEIPVKLTTYSGIPN